MGRAARRPGLTAEACSDAHSWTSWGNDAQQADVDDMIAIVNATCTTGGYACVGGSRGGQSALNTMLRKSARVSVGPGPVCSTSWAYSPFKGEIDTAYGITGTTPNTYVEKTAGRDPLLFDAAADDGPDLDVPGPAELSTIGAFGERRPGRHGQGLGFGGGLPPVGQESVELAAGRSRECGPTRRGGTPRGPGRAAARAG